MFLTDPILWLQSFASPALTRVMDGISWFGYTRAAIVVITFLAFAHRLRPAVAVLVLIGLTATATDVAKTLTDRPRPYQVDARVAALGSFVPGADADGDQGTSFPSGHVATTTAVLLGMLWLFKWRRAWWGFVVWLPLMALSRLYLGRHFPGDVLGGVLLALVTAAIALAALDLRSLAGSSSVPAARRAATRIIIVAAATVVLAWWARQPSMTDAGRLLGFASAALLIAHVDVPDVPQSWGRRAGLVLLAAGAFGLVWALLTVAFREAGVTPSPGARLAAAALPAFAMLAVPCWVARQPRSPA